MDDAENRRVELCSLLGIDTDTGWSDAAVEMDKRLMPKGMEWPCFEDGDKVKFGDYVKQKDNGCRFTVETIEFINDGWSAVAQKDGLRNVYRPGELVKLTGPEAIGNDGFPIKVGDSVWDAITGGGPFLVKEIKFDDDRDEPEDIVWCGEYVKNSFKMFRIANNLTHTKPDQTDSWEKWRNDVSLAAYKYLKDIMGADISKQESDPDDYETMATDLERRAKALIEKENNRED